MGKGVGLPIRVQVLCVPGHASYAKKSTEKTLRQFIGVSQVTVVMSGPGHMVIALRKRMATMHLQNTLKSTNLIGWKTKEHSGSQNLQKLFEAPNMGSGEDIRI